MQRKKGLIKNEKNNENYCFVKKYTGIRGLKYKYSAYSI